MYYIFVEDNEIAGKGQAKCLNDEVLNFEVTKEIFDEFEKYTFKDGQIVFDEDFEEKQKQKERKEKDMMMLTAADVERAIYKARGMDFEDLIEFVQKNDTNNILDIKALKIELKANNFYRGNPYINKIGTMLNYSSDELDYLFKNKELPNKAQNA